MDTPTAPIESQSEKKDFALAEYKESSTAFFKGVDIGFSFLRFFFIINAALAAVLQLDDKIMEKVSALRQLVPYIIPGIGILFSLLLLLIIPYYSKQLDHCSKRCSEIENRYGGSLFAGIHATNHDTRRGPFTATFALGILALVVCTLWFLAIPGFIDALRIAVSHVLK